MIERPSNEPVCPSCQTALVHSSVRGLCARCLVARTLALPAAGPDGHFAVPSVAEVGAEFPHLEIRGLLGRGGMGAVYEAWQPVLERTVALKVLPPALLGTADFLDRFQHEARAMARLDHPAVAQVFETGVTEGGEPYIVMELVRGEPITAFAVRKQLEVKARLALFREVCAGVQHAHQKGVIHRDLKPSNILVAETDGRPVAKVIDFGLAIPAAAEVRRDAGWAGDSTVGTPAYMSPEQRAGDEVDTRTDVYSLGVLLRELLTGETATQTSGPGTTDSGSAAPLPLAADSATSTTRAPSALGRDLDAILAQALATRPAERYPTVGALADDLERLARHEPVAAVVPTAAYLLGKFLRRHRAGVVAVAGLLALFALGVALIVRESWLTRRAEQLAEARLRQGENLIEFMLGDLHVKLHELGRLDVMEAAIAATEKFHAEAPLTEAPPESRRNRAHALLALGRIRNAQGKADAARRHYDEAIRLYRAATEARPTEPVWREEFAQAWNSLAVLHHQAREVPAAEAAYREALRINERMRAQEPHNANWTDSRAGFLHNLAALYDLAGRLDDAVRTYEAALELWTPLLEREPNNPGFLEHLAEFHQNLAFVHGRQGNLAKVEAANAEALRIREWLVEHDPGNMNWLAQLANIRQNISEVHRGQNRFTEAEAWLDRYLPIRERLAARDPSNAGWQQLLADAHRARADLLARRGEDASAAVEYRRAWEIFEPLLARGGGDADWPRRWRDGLKAAEEVFARLAHRTATQGNSPEAGEAERTLSEIRRKLAGETPGAR